MRFSAEEAHDAHDDGEPIMLGNAALLSILSEHSANVDQFEGDHPNHVYVQNPIDAWTVLEWLGY
jgi:hypothetical protein